MRGSIRTNSDGERWLRVPIILRRGIYVCRGEWLVCGSNRGRSLAAVFVLVAVWMLFVHGCASAVRTSPRLVARRLVPPDVHGEPLALLPPQPLAWLRVEVAEARASQHWGTLVTMLEREAGETLAAVERELGLDLFRQAEVFALGLYSPPGAGHGIGGRAWPVLYVRGNFDGEAVLAAARVRAPSDDPLLPRREGRLRFHATRSRAYLFPARDVLVMFDPALARRLARQLSGEERGSALRDERFDMLWSQTGGRAGTLQAALDAAALRTIGPSLEATEELAQSIDRAVVRVEAPGELHLRVVALATDERAAERLVASVDETRQWLLRRFEIRLLGLSRLLNQGVTAVHEARLVRMQIDAHAEEVSRVLRAAQLLQVTTRPAVD